jgi:hypothetical protein
VCRQVRRNCRCDLGPGARCAIRTNWNTVMGWCEMTYQRPGVAERGHEQADQLPEVGHQPAVAALADGAQGQNRRLARPPVLVLLCNGNSSICCYICCSNNAATMLPVVGLLASGGG